MAKRRPAKPPIATKVPKETAFPEFARRHLRIRTKAGAIAPLSINAAQKFIHRKAEDQLARTGRVRIIALKGRQQGFSTYVQARFYHRVIGRAGVRAYILTHSSAATENLFGITDRLHKNCPEDLRPKIRKVNAKELSFADLDSSYRVGTARTDAVGRSETIQYFHGSEVGFWDNAEEHIAGILQAVPPTAGTEIWLESTANGVGNFFHRECMKAIQGRSAFEFIFVPWFWQTEYRTPVTGKETFKPTPDEAELVSRHTLDVAQLNWRRGKLAEIGEHKFRQEYPCTPEEAFAVEGFDVLIGPGLIRAAVGRDVEPVDAPVIWGVDPSRFGDDRKTLAKRKGNALLEPVKVLLKDQDADTQAVAGAIHHEFNTTPPGDRPISICVDAIGIGAGVADALRAQGLPVKDVNVAERPASQAKFNKLRDELWWAAREWFEDRRCQIPPDEDLITELAAVTYDHTASDRIRIESKKDMKKRLGYSPDKADAFILTFAAPDTPARKTRRDRVAGGPNAWMAI